MRRVRRVVTALVAMLAAVGLVIGVVSGVLPDLARDGLSATGLWTRNGAATGSTPGTGATTSSRIPSPSSTPQPGGPSTPIGPPAASGPPTPSSSDTPSGLPAPVLAAATAGSTPSKAKVAAKIRSVKVKDVSASAYTAAVLDVGSGQTLYAHNAGRAYIPASTMKLLTSAAALSILGPEHTFSTRVVSPKAGRIILVGGGDPYLATKTSADSYPQRASVSALARSTATALKKAKISTVDLGYDDSLFTGPRWNPSWPDFYRDQVTPVSALWVDEGRVSGSPGPRVKDPSRDAANAYAGALRKQGIRVGRVSPEKATAAAAPVASIASLPLERIVEQLLLVSDNDAAEVVLRQAAIGAGKKGSAAEGTAAVRAQLTKLGVWADGTRIDDGSGLSRRIRVPAQTMVQVLRLAASTRGSELRAVITGLPVAGVEGSLRTHYSDDESLAGRGVVRGKTGTLNKVHSLAGLIRTRDGSLLVYAFLINGAKNDYNATVWLDRASAALSTCGCRS